MKMEKNLFTRLILFGKYYTTSGRIRIYWMVGWVIRLNFSRSPSALYRKRKMGMCETINDDDLSVSKVIEKEKIIDVRGLKGSFAATQQGREQILWHNIRAHLKCEENDSKVVILCGWARKGLVWNLEGKLKK